MTDHLPSDYQFIGADLLHYLQVGFHAHKTPADEQQEILRRIDSHILMDGLLKNVESGMLQISGLRDGEMTFIITGDGIDRAEAIIGKKR